MPVYMGDAVTNPNAKIESRIVVWVGFGPLAV
jgi:hypothetical protein